MHLACGICGTWTVQIAGLEVWSREDGPAKEFVTGRCATCTSVQLVEPSVTAVESASARIRASRKAIRAVAGDG